MRHVNSSSRINYKKILGIQLTLFLLYVPFFGQDAWNAQNYNGIPTDGKKIIYLEEFKDNQNRWIMGTKYLEEAIQNNRYYISNLSDYTYVKHRPVSLKAVQNYEVEIKVRIVTPSSKDGFGLVLGRDKRGNEFTFKLSEDPSDSGPQFIKYESSRRTELPNHCCQNAITDNEQDVYTKLMVRKLGDH